MCKTDFSCGFLRAKLKLPQKTMSLWSWVNRPEELSRFQNPLYEANSLVIWPSVAPQSLQLWEGEPGLLALLQAISLVIFFFFCQTSFLTILEDSCAEGFLLQKLSPEELVLKSS